MPVSLDELPQSCRGASGAPTRSGKADAIDIGLVNNMPDAALEKTERQFIGLLNAAAGGRPIHVKLYSLPEIVRAGAARDRVALHYSPIDELWDARLDGLIVTGTEPRALDLHDEPYWRTMTRVIDWAETNTRSTILSCLAAHAAVLHMDGIRRHPLADKYFGIFDSVASADQAIMRGLPPRFRIPHSRWNEVRAEELAAAGYNILTRSGDGSVDMFARQGNSLFMFFQGHPEYEARTLLGEYRRDVRRFLRGEAEIYPSIPRDYFDASTVQRLAEFRRHAVLDRHEALIEAFPGCSEERLQAPWRPAAELLMSNWFSQLEPAVIPATAHASVVASTRTSAVQPDGLDF